MKEIQISTGFSQKDIGILGNFIGKKLVKIRHDTFDVDNIVMCVLWNWSSTTPLTAS